jgi:transposase
LDLSVGNASGLGDVDDCTCAVGARWCARADALFGVTGMHVLDVAGDERGWLLLTVETDQTVAGCPSCGVVATGHGRRVHRVHGAPCFVASTVLVWRKRVWRCPEPGCPIQTFSETHDLVAPRAKLTTRAAVCWATDALTHDDTTVSALARHLGVDWHTLWDAVEVEATTPPATVARAGRADVTPPEAPPSAATEDAEQ